MTPEEIADRALALAEEFLEKSRKEIVALAASDSGALYEASQIVRERAAGVPPSARSAEHLAFSLITAAHEHLRVRPGGEPPPG
jgi:hypothetical protein